MLSTLLAMSRTLIYSLLVLLSISTVAYSATLAVMSIDVGNEYMKIALVKPGIPMEIVLNSESARKTQTVVQIHNNERTFGNTAASNAVRFPANTFMFIRDLLGKNTSNPVVQEYLVRFPYYKLEDDLERATINFVLPDGTKYSVEELMAMIFETAKQYADTFADQKISDAVIVCPVYFNQAERRALKRAAELAGLKVLRLMTSPAAVALNYGIFRRNEFNSTEQTYMFFDMGSTSTTATVVGYQVVKTKVGSRTETNPQLVVKGVGVDRSLGSLEMTLRLRDHLAKAFNDQKKTKNDVFKNPKAMAKLLKEAERVKKILSANNDTFAQIENLMDEKDFKTKLSRVEFESICADLFERVPAVIEEALRTSQMNMNEVTELILMGGGTRIPKIREVLQKTINRQELGQSINADEAAALGAVYEAADLSTGFKVKPFAVKEANLYPIQVEFERTKTDDDGSESTKIIKRTLFTRLNPYPQKKVMTFNKHTQDFTFDVNYGDLSFLSNKDLQVFGSTNLTRIDLEGVTEKVSSLSDNFTEFKGVKAHFRLDNSGLLFLDNVEVTFERQPQLSSEESTLSKLSNTISNFFGSGTTEQAEGAAKEEEPETSSAAPDSTQGSENESSKEQSETPESEKSETPESAKSEQSDSTQGKDTSESDEKKTTDGSAKVNETVANNATSSNKTSSENKPVLIKREVVSKIVVLDAAEPVEEHTLASRKLLAEFTKRDEDKKKLAAVKNELEAFGYDVKNKLSEKDYMKCSTAEQRTAINEKLSAIMEWYEEQGIETTRQEYEDKLSEAKKAVRDLNLKVKEFQERPNVMDALKSTLNHTKYILKGMQNYSSSVPAGEGPFTDVELGALEKLYTDSKDWMDKKNKEQKALACHETAAFTVDDVVSKISALDREVKYLLNKAKTFVPKKPKKPTKEANTTKTEDGETKTEKDSDGKTEGQSSSDIPSESSGGPETMDTKEDFNIPAQEKQEETGRRKKPVKAEENNQEPLQLDGGDQPSESEKRVEL